MRWVARRVVKEIAKRPVIKIVGVERVARCCTKLHQEKEVEVDSRNFLYIGEWGFSVANSNERKRIRWRKYSNF